MRILGATALILLAWAGQAMAQSQVGLSRHASPGFDNLRLPEPLPSWFALALTSGYGYTESVLGTDDQHHRVVGGLAATVQPIRWLAFTLEFDSRYDRHAKVEQNGDDSYVGEPSLGINGMFEAVPNLTLGLAIDLRFTYRGPGFDPLPKSVSPAFTAEMGYRTGPLTLGFSAGYLLDQSGEAIESPDALSRADRLALDVSAFDRVLVSLGGEVRISDFSVLAELGWQPLLGAGAPSASVWPLDASVGARYLPDGSWFQVQLMASFALTSRPRIDVGEPLVPVAPRVAILASLGFIPTFGGDDEAQPIVVAPPPPPPAPSFIAGRVVSPGDVPVEGAVVSRMQDGRRVTTATTTADGRFSIGPLEAGTVRLSIVGSGRVSRNIEISIGVGATERISVVLEPDLPAGELRGTVRSFRGHGIKTVLKVEPLGIEVATDDKGWFSVPIQPGSYEVVIAAPGFVGQRRQIEIQPNGVTYVNVDLNEER